MPSKTPPGRWPGGIRAQVLGPSLCVMVLTFALSLFTMTRLHQTHQMQLVAEHLSAQARLLALFKAPPSQGSMDAMARHGGVQGLLWRRGGQERVAGYMRPGGGWPVLGPGEETRVEQRELGGERGWMAMAKEGEVEAWAMMDGAIVEGKLGLTRRLMWVYVLLGSGFVAILCWALFTFLVLGPLRALGRATERASQGNLTQPVSATPPNELGQVAWRFNQMLERLNTQRLRLEAQLGTIERAHQQLQLAQTSLIRSEKLASVGQLAAGVAHEVGNPLAIVQGYAELLADGDIDPKEVAGVGRTIGKQVERMQGIVRQMLDYSREDVTQGLGPVALHEVVLEAISLATTTKRFRGIAVHPPPDLALAPHVLAHSAQTIQVLLNLLLNAADATGQGGQIHITWHIAPDTHQLLLSLQDDGPGVPKEAQAKLFEPFFTTKEPGQGTGLGLAISRRIMERFGGDLEHVEVPGKKGARFVLRFEVLRAL